MVPKIITAGNTIKKTAINVMDKIYSHMRRHTLDHIITFLYLILGKKFQTKV